MNSILRTLVLAALLAATAFGQLQQFGTIASGGYGKIGGPVGAVGISATDNLLSGFGSAVWQFDGALIGAHFAHGGISPFGGLQVKPVSKLLPIALSVYGGTSPSYDPFGAAVIESRKIQWRGFIPSAGIRVAHDGSQALIQARREIWKSLGALSFEAGTGKSFYMSGAVHLKLGKLFQAINGA